MYRVAAGIVGAVGVAVCVLLRRRRSTLADMSALPHGLVPAIGATVFGVATLALTAQAMQGIGWHTTAGLGQWLSAAIVSAACAAVFTVEFVRELRTAVVLVTITGRCCRCWLSRAAWRV